MTFGTEWGWGAEESTAAALFEQYLAAGGNFVDTADGYTNGKSEEMLGKFIKERHARDRIVLATKFTFSGEVGNPNAGGNGRKNVYRALEGSLRRLGTDYIDLYWMHAWDGITPVEEVLRTFDDLVRDGKIRHYGFSDVPAWYVSRAQTLAEKEGKDRLIALQLEYSLVERSIEREHVPVAQELGIGICPWSPLAGGFLSGKYLGGDPARDHVGDHRSHQGISTREEPGGPRLRDPRATAVPARTGKRPRADPSLRVFRSFLSKDDPWGCRSSALEPPRWVAD